MPDRPPTAWATGRLDGRDQHPQLLFGRMHEDWSVEARLFPARSRVFCIGSAGCTALALASLGHRVTAVDINPAQVDYLRARLAGAQTRDGRVDGLMRRLRRVATLAGYRRPMLHAFLSMSDPEAQGRFWRWQLDTCVMRGALTMLTHPRVLRRFYAPPFVDLLPPRMDRILRQRLARGWRTHPNRDNPYAWRLLLGEEPPHRDTALALPVHQPIVARGDAAGYLETCPPGSFDAFTLSNILDGATDAYRHRLAAAIRHAAAPGAVVLHRTLLEPVDERAGELAAEDRSMLWGGIELYRIPATTGDTQQEPLLCSTC